MGMNSEEAQAAKTARQLRDASNYFLDELNRLDLLDHPLVFITLDKEARKRGFAIRAEQKGVFGTTLTLCRVEDL